MIMIIIIGIQLICKILIIVKINNSIMLNLKILRIWMMGMLIIWIYKM